MLGCEGQNTYSVQRSVEAGEDAVVLCSGNPDRVAIVVSSPPMARITLSAQSSELDDGLNVYPGTLPLMLSAEVNGDMVIRTWFVVSAVTQYVNVTEVYRRR